MSQVAILYPVFVQVLLVFAMAFLLVGARSRAMRSMNLKQGAGDLAMGRAPWPEDAAKRSANYSNQFELPVLFYAVVAFALIVKGADLIMIILAWAFVLTRVLHAAIHVGPNKVRWRAPAFGVGLLIVMIMWLKLAVHVIGNA